MRVDWRAMTNSRSERQIRKDRAALMRGVERRCEHADATPRSHVEDEHIGRAVAGELRPERGYVVVMIVMMVAAVVVIRVARAREVGPVGRYRRLKIGLVPVLQVAPIEQVLKFMRVCCTLRDRHPRIAVRIDTDGRYRRLV